MKNCPNCGKKVSDYLPNCPNCGMALLEYAESKEVATKEQLNMEKIKSQILINIILLLVDGFFSFPLLITTIIIAYSIYNIIKYQLHRKMSFIITISITIFIEAVNIIVMGKSAIINVYTSVAYSGGIDFLRLSLILKAIFGVCLIICLAIETSYLILNWKKK